jgi:16S rRNA (guanine527-N7)-methyltransferase
MNQQIQQIPTMMKQEISLSQQQQLQNYAGLLKQYNQKLNLISRRDIANLWENHIFPSILVNNFVDFPVGAEVADLGSGGGLPGIPLKIIRPDLKLVLIDSSLKKTAFLRQVIHRLEMKDAQVLQHRLLPREEVEMLHRRFDIVLARAVSGFQELWNLGFPLLANQGFLVAWKGESDLTELQSVARKAGFKYRAIRIPEIYWKYSPKLQYLAYIEMWSDSAAQEGDGERRHF